MGSAVKEVPGSWSSVIWSRLGGKPSRPSTSNREELEAAAKEDAGAGADKTKKVYKEHL